MTFGRRAAGSMARGLRGRGWLARVLTVLAGLALLTPSLSAVDPDLAGWTPAHEHVYEGGVPIEHSHPWDVTGGASSDDDRVTFVWGTDSVVLAVVVPAAIAVITISTLLVALGQLAPAAPRLVFASIPTPPPR